MHSAQCPHVQAEVAMSTGPGHNMRTPYTPEQIFQGAGPRPRVRRISEMSPLPGKHKKEIQPVFAGTPRRLHAVSAQEAVRGVESLGGVRLKGESGGVFERVR